MCLPVTGAFFNPFISLPILPDLHFPVLPEALRFGFDLFPAAAVSQHQCYDINWSALPDNHPQSLSHVSHSKVSCASH